MLCLNSIGHFLFLFHSSTPLFQGVRHRYRHRHRRLITKHPPSGELIKCAYKVL